MDQDNKMIMGDSDEISLKELILKVQEWWRFILTKWKIILISGIIGGIIGLGYAWLKKPFYKAELSFALQNEKAGGGLSGAMGIVSQLGIDLGGNAGGEFSGDNLLELMKSRSMVEKALLTPIVIKGKKVTLAEYYIDFNKLREDWKGNSKFKNIHFLPNQDRLKFTLEQNSLLESFYGALITNSLTVSKIDKNLSIISLRVKSTDEIFSKYFAEILTKVVSDFYIQTKIEKGSRNVAVLQRQTDSVRRMLYGAISGVATSFDVNPNPNPLLAATLRVPSQRRQVDVQANTAILTQLVTNLEIAKMSLLQEMPLIQVIDRPIFPLQKDRIGKSTGLLLGVIIGVFLVVAIYLSMFLYRNIMK